MIATTTDYTGRTVDLEIFQTENPPAAIKELSLTLSDAGQARRVTGLQKLAQRYMLTFFTPKGSVPLRSAYGTVFMLVVAQGLLQSRAAVVQYFDFANMDCGQQLIFQDRSPEGLRTPEDERYANSYLLDYAVDTGAAKLYLKVKLESQAGESYVFVLPVT